MKRYLVNRELRELRRVDTDVVVIGGGAAGLYAALNLDRRLRCAVLNKSGAELCNSMYAQGGIAAVVRPNDADDPQLHLKDTLVAGAGLCDEEAVSVLVHEAWGDIQRLVELGVPFDTENDRFLLTREGGHGKNRILHCGGDATGLHLTRSLYAAVSSRNNIRMFDYMRLTDIVTDDRGCVAGVLALDEHSDPVYFAASKVIVASGGIGRVYRHSTNTVCATGDGIAAAARAGAELTDMEFVQFHPTAFVQPNVSGRFFLISEALRGEGAVLRNGRGEAFMRGAHPLADLAPRDVVSRAIAAEMERTHADQVYLDITSRSAAFLEKRFPTIYGECRRHGVRIEEDPIPVVPVQHYFMGGVKTDLCGRTNVPGLYAAGEAACTGVHGANRLASNSLLECLVFGRRCAQDIGGSEVEAPGPVSLRPVPLRRNDGAGFEAWSEEIRSLMTRKCGIVRHEREMMEAYARIGEIYRRLDALELPTYDAVETFNRSMVAMAVLRASILRKNSVGAHCRGDAVIGGNRIV